MLRHLFVLATLACTLSISLRAQLNLVTQFSTGGTAVSCAYAPQTDTVWVYGAFASTIRKFSTTGSLLGSIPRPGGSGNDADLDVAPTALDLGGTVVPQGSLLFIDGESGVAEIYAVNPWSGAVVASLTTAFGDSHVVGGAYHPQRGTFFLVQDRVPGSAALKNLVAEIDSATGAVLGTFHTTSANAAFTVNFGDLDVAANGNLMIASSDESEIGEFTPSGAWVDGHVLPNTGGLSGLGLDEAGCDVWVISSTGWVSELSVGSCPSVTTIGTGCGGHAIAVTSLPWAGGTFRTTATGLPPIAIGVAITGLSQLAPPIPLSVVMPQGQPGCTAYVAFDILELLPVTGGTAQSQLALPSTPAANGFQFFHQIGVLEWQPFSQTIVAATVTDALQATVGSY